MISKNNIIIYFVVLLAIIVLPFFLKSPETPVVEQPTVPVEEEVIVEKPEFELKIASFNELKNWQNDDTNKIKEAFILSCSRIKFEKNEFLSNAVAKISTEKYKQLCEDFSQTKTPIKQWIEEKFNPYLVTFKGSEKGKFTSYYEAALSASKNKSDKYKYPIYGKPKDLIEFNARDFDKDAPNKRYVGRVKNQKLIPYNTRKEIDSGSFDAPVILWSDSYVDIYVMQIQGSAVAELDDGTSVRIGYADNNGHLFKGIGSILLENKLIQPGQASMGKIKKWLVENLETAKPYMMENERFIFHQILDSKGPIGAQGVPLSAGRSLAVDRHFIPLGSLLWLETTGPNREPIEKLVVAQDIGGAIKGAVRGDYFWGSGKDDILDLAGRMNSEGRYFIMIPKD